jgi:hypothetical protein
VRFTDLPARRRIPDEASFTARTIEQHNKHGKWLKISGSNGYTSAPRPQSVVRGYRVLLTEYGRSSDGTAS